MIPKYRADFGHQDQLTVEHCDDPAHEVGRLKYAKKLHRRRKKHAIPWLRDWWQVYLQLRGLRRMLYMKSMSGALQQILVEWKFWTFFMINMRRLTARHKAWALLNLVGVWDIQDQRKWIALRWLRDIWGLYCKAQLLSKMVHCRITLGAIGQIVVRWRKLT